MEIARVLLQHGLETLSKVMDSPALIVTTALPLALSAIWLKRSVMVDNAAWLIST